MMRFVSFLVGSESLIGMMLLIRVLLRSKIPPGILYALWLVPAVRLLVPVTLIPVPVLPEVVGEAADFDEGVEKAAADYRSAAIRAVSEAQAAAHATIAENAQDTGRVGNGEVTEAFFLTENREDMQEAEKAEMLSCLICIWFSGSAFCGGYVVLINRRLKRSIKQMERLAEKRLVPVYIREETVSPCLFGLFHPCILLSKQTARNKELCRQVLLHEETHYRQKDHIWTAFRISLCILYWWNPLVWLGAVYAREDAAEEIIEAFNAQTEGEPGKTAVEEPEPVKKENDREVANRIKDAGKENGQEEWTEKTESGIGVRPREHREGYREPDLHYTASAGWLTDLTGRLEEQETTENLAVNNIYDPYPADAQH